MLGQYTQAGRLMRAKFANLGEDDLLLEKFEGTESLSGLFQIELSLLAELLTPISFERILGEAVCVTMPLPGGGDRYFHGIVRRLTRAMTVLGPGGAPSFYRYQALVVPKLWLLTRRVQSRYFSQRSVPDILREVLDNLDVEWQLTETYPARDFCAQYRESDFAFVSRLMEDEGIYYYFKHEAEKHTLVIADAPVGHANVPGPLLVRLDPGEQPVVIDEDRVISWEKSQEVASGMYTVWDYSFALADKKLAGDEKIAEKVKVGVAEHTLHVAHNVEDLQVFDYPGGYADRYDPVSPQGTDKDSAASNAHKDKSRVAQLRMQEQAAASLNCRGEGRVRHFTAGHKFTLAAPLALFDASGTYVLTRVEHSANLTGAYITGNAAATAKPSYSTRFECLPEAVIFRPRRVTPRPQISGLQTAVVVGPGGMDVFPDKYGRVRVQFFWDRTGQNALNDQRGDALISLNYWQGGEASPVIGSCWVRVAQPWAGRKFGAVFVPRLGQEVVVAFLEGDPDRPLIVGSVYNEVNQPAVNFPVGGLCTGIKTHLGGGDAQGYSGLIFDDRLGFVHLHSQKHMVISTEGSLVLNIGGDFLVNLTGREHRSSSSQKGLMQLGG